MTKTEERFRAKVEITETCWNWTGCVLQCGYGQFRANGQRIYAHRYSYELYEDSIPIGLVIDHLCRNRRCVNPKHLEPVTTRENIRRGIGVGNGVKRLKPGEIRVACKWGHKLNKQNTYMYGRYAMCRTCRHTRYVEFVGRKAATLLK